MNRFKPHIALLICNIVWAMDYPFYNIVLPRYVHPMAMVSGSLIATALFSLVPLLVLLGMDRFTKLKIAGLVLGSYSVPPRHVDPPTAAPH